MRDDHWLRGPIAGFDLESTGVDVERDEVVQSAVVTRFPGCEAASFVRLADPGRDIPEGASDVHGITTEVARRDGLPLVDVVRETVERLAQCIEKDTPIIGMNLTYDFTLLDRSCRRLGIVPLSDRFEFLGPIVDIRVLDKKAEKFRKGTRKLVDLCAHYGVALDGAHDAGFDALGAMRVAWKIALHPRYGPWFDGNAEWLHDRQTEWAREQHIGFMEYRAEKAAKEWAAGCTVERWNELHIDPAGACWPIRPFDPWRVDFRPPAPPVRVEPAPVGDVGQAEPLDLLRDGLGAEHMATIGKEGE